MTRATGRTARSTSHRAVVDRLGGGPEQVAPEVGRHAEVLPSIGGDTWPPVPVKDAGPYVHLGSYRIHVWTMLGRPSSILRDGTWLYKDFSAQASAAQGTLVVRFDQGQVSQLSLVSTAVATAMLSSPAPEPAAALISRR